MGAEATVDVEAAGGEDHLPERTCVVTRAKGAPEELIRFVRAPDDTIVPDLACRLPGRGVWVTCSRRLVEEAVKRGAFARSLKRQVTVPADLAARIDRLLVERAQGAFGFANKAGLVTAGFTRVENAIDKGAAFALVHASDAAEDGRQKLDRKYCRSLKEAEATHAPEIVTELTSDELSLATGRSHVVHAALAKGGAALNFLKEAGRLRRYRQTVDDAAKRPLGSGSDTE